MATSTKKPATDGAESLPTDPAPVAPPATQPLATVPATPPAKPPLVRQADRYSGIGGEYVRDPVTGIRRPKDAPSAPPAVAES